MNLRRTVFLIALLSFSSAWGQSGAGDDNRPNILLIVADDLGYADLGIFGSDINTPNIDELAARGMILTQFHTSPSCGPTRAMLLSGNNNHVAGTAKQNTTGVAGWPVRGYENHLSDRIVPFPRLLQESGYHTYTVGKWHLGMAAEHSPRAAGFSRAFNMLKGAGTHYDAKGYMVGGSKYRLDDDLVEYPVGRYSTDLHTDRLIEFIESNKDSGKPFFAYAAYTSPHWPLQVPEEYLHIYAGQYDDGYDALRERRFDSLQEAGIVPLASELPPRNDAITRWEELSSDQQRYESRKMELYAAMVDNLDDHVGRLIAYLQDSGLYDNTLIIFMSDNGAAGEDFYNGIGYAGYVEYLQETFDNSYDKMGTADSFISYGPQWAEAGSAPFQRFKTYSREGGIVAPMIIAGAGVAAHGIIDSTYLTVMDLAPTFLEIASAKYPDDGSVQPMLGESINRFLAGETDSIHDDNYVSTQYHDGHAFVRQGNWKISNLEPPFDESGFELFDLGNDPGESNNLAEAEPEKLAEMIALWRVQRKKLGIILPQDL